MEPALWPVFRCRHFSKKVGSVQWLESAFYQRPRMTLADASASSDVRFARPFDGDKIGDDLAPELRWTFLRP
jgi:hypothetical protein